MGLRMTTASKRRDSEKEQYQRRVPKPVLKHAEGRLYPIVLPRVGAVAEEVVDVRIRPSISFSLRVVGEQAGKIRTAAVNAQLDAIFEGVRSGPVDLTRMQISGLSGEVYRLLFDSFKAEPGEPEHWEAWKAFTWAAIEGRVANPPPASWREFMLDHHAAHGHFGINRGPELLDAVERLPPGDNAMSLERRFGGLAMWVLARHGLEITQSSRQKLLLQIGEDSLRAGLRLKRATQGDYSPDPEEQRFPNFELKTSRSVISLNNIFESWWREAKAAGCKPSTYQSYEKTLRYLVAFLKHEDATIVTPEDIVAFKIHRLSTPNERTGKPPKPKTVKDSDLAALKTIFGWAVSNRKIPTNPASDVTVAVGKRRRVRPSGFVEAEAYAILSAALHYVSGKREGAGTASAKRWLPWLCAFSGARVGEMAQLRRQDLRREGDIWVINITPDAGTVKNNEARDIVLHNQLIELGFPAFVKASPEGHLFLKLGKGGDVLGPLQALKNRMVEFVRPIVPDPNVQPNHGWRHLFTTKCEEAGINPRVYNAIMGHAARTVAEGYGNVTLKAMALAIEKLQSFDLDRLQAIPFEQGKLLDGDISVLMAVRR